MRRDMELVREILLFLEEDDKTKYCDQGSNYMLICIDGYTKEEIDYHLTIMKDGEFIKGELPIADDEIITHSGIRLNWKSHDFLETFKKDNIWNKTKERIKNKGLQISEIPMDILIEVGKEYMKKLL